MVTLGLLFQAFVIVIACMPEDTKVTPQTMNYSVVLNGAAIIFAFVYYYTYKKDRLIGPNSNLIDEEYIDAVDSDIKNNIDDIFEGKEDHSSA